MSFAHEIDPSIAEDLSNYEIETWGLKRSKKYGSDRYEKKKLLIANAQVLKDGKTIKLFIPDIKVTDGMTISYKLKDAEGFLIEGKLQNTIHQLGKENHI